MKWMNHKHIILASQSPRRKELLSSAGFTFEIAVADIDEDNYPPELFIQDIPAFLAKKKAEKIWNTHLYDGKIILAADSLVFYNDEVFTKPVDRKDAEQILKSLSGKTHTVITGICLKGSDFLDIDSVYTEVSFEDFTDEEINYYIDNYKPYDKAGAYGIQDWIGLCKIRTIKGSYTNIMGLPMEKVYSMLKDRMT